MRVKEFDKLPADSKRARLNVIANSAHQIIEQFDTPSNSHPSQTTTQEVLVTLIYDEPLWFAGAEDYEHAIGGSSHIALARFIEKHPELLRDGVTLRIVYG